MTIVLLYVTVKTVKKGDRKMLSKDILKGDKKFRYMLLSRMQSDCNYYLGNGRRNAKHLWAENEADHIQNMKDLWNSFPENAKPEWLSMEDIREYEKKMI